MFESITHLFEFFTKKIIFGKKPALSKNFGKVRGIDKLLEEVLETEDDHKSFVQTDFCDVSRSESRFECDFERPISKKSFDKKSLKKNAQIFFEEDFSFSKLASVKQHFSIQRDMCVCESRLERDYFALDRLIYDLSHQPSLTEAEENDYWLQISDCGMEMTRILSGVGYIAMLYLEQLKKQAKYPQKNYFLFESVTMLRGAYENDEWSKYLNELVRNFEANLDLLKVAFADNDKDKIAEIQDFFNFQMTTLPVKAFTLLDWYKKLQVFIAAKDEGEKACLMTYPPDVLKEKMIVLDGIAEKMDLMEKAIYANNMKLCVKSVKGSKMTKNLYEDAIMDGCMHLSNIIRHYDYTCGTPFYCYTMSALKRKCAEFINNQSLVKIPRNDLPLLREIKSFILQYKNENGGAEPSCQIIADNFNETEKKVRNLLILSKTVVNPTNSEDNGDDNDGEIQIADISEDTERKLQLREQKIQLYLALGKLSAQQRKIIIMHKGLRGTPHPGVEMTNSEIADELNISDSSVSQTLNLAIKNLRIYMNSERMVGR